MNAPVRRFRGRVLLVEDNPVNRLVARTLLQNMGLDPVCAVDGAEALDHLDGENFDLVLMDCQLPGLDGYEVTRRWRQQERTAGREPTPIVALTANALPEDRARSLASGMDDHVAKPYRSDALAEVLARYLAPA